MKTTFTLLAILFSSTSMAGTINFTTTPHSYTRYPDQMESIVMAEERALTMYLGKELECRLVQLQFNNHRSPTLFTRGEYNLTVTAECNKSFRDFKMGVNYGYSLGEPIALNLSYTSNGLLIKKKIQLSENDD